MKGFLRLRGSTYYFRCRVPHDLHGTFFQGEEILKSLHTKDRKHAQESAAEWYCRVNRVFQLCRIRSLPQEQLQALVKSELNPTRIGATYSNPSPHLKDLFDNYVNEHKVNWREKSYDEVTYSLELALDVIGNVQTSQLSPEVVKTFLATILQRVFASTCSG